MGILFDKLSNIYDEMDDVNDEVTEKFMDNKYLGMMQVSLMYLKMDKSHRVLSTVQFIIYYGIIIFNMSHMINSFPILIKINFTIFTQCAHLALLTGLVGTVVFYYQRNRKPFFLIHRTIAQDFYDYQEPELEEVGQLRKEMDSQRKRLVVVPVSAVVAAGTVISLAPIVDRYGTFDFESIDNITSTNLPFAFAVYIYDVREGIAYYTALILQLALCFVLAAPIGNSGYAYLLITQNLMFQLKILLASLENIEKRALELCSRQFGHKKSRFSNRQLYDEKEFTYCYDLCLKKNFEHHQIILRYFYNLREVFSVTVFLSYMIGTIVIALSLLSTGSGHELPGTTVASVLLCFAEVGFMYLFSVFSQYITDLSLDLRFVMYSSKWYHCNERTKRSIAIFQAMTLQPMTLTAGGIVPANMDTFSKVMNSAYSYYNLVNAFDFSS